MTAISTAGLADRITDSNLFWVGIVAALVVGLVWAYIELTHPLPTPPVAAPAPVTAAGGPVRADRWCMVPDCTEEWVVGMHGWRTCLEHDARAPFDQATTGDDVVAAAESLTRKGVQW